MLSVGILIHELTIDAANRFVELLDPTAGYWLCGALNLIARGLVDDERLRARQSEVQA